VFNKSTDGINHINVNYEGNTNLGVFLSNGYTYPITVDGMGQFQCIDSLWYYLLTSNDDLRYATGGTPRRIASKHLGDPICSSEEEFRSIIKGAVNNKIQSSQFRSTFIDCKLPFVEYYVYNNKQYSGKNVWLINYINELRIELATF
jgi:hypothetical protein